MPPSPDLVRALAVTAELTGALLSQEAARMMLADLEGFDERAVLTALHRCRLELRGHLTIGAILDRLDDGHPGPETAWAMVAELTEDDTVVWTAEIAESYGLVRGLDDRVAARMAFLEQYRHKLAAARAAQRPPDWTLSLGMDPTKREGPIRAAVAQGRLSDTVVRAALPPAEPTRALTEGQHVDRSQVAALVRDLGQRLAGDRRSGTDRTARPESPAMEQDPLYRLAQGGADARRAGHD